MERLTKIVGGAAVPTSFDLGFGLDISDKDWNGLKAVLDRLAAYEDTGLEPKDIKYIRHDPISEAAMFLHTTSDRLRELAQADRKGRVLALLCGIGQHVFSAQSGNKQLVECEVKRIIAERNHTVVILEPVNESGHEFGVTESAFGKIVFLSREGHEEKKEMPGMSDFERQIYADMTSVDRVSLYMVKCMELIEFQKVMTEEDIQLLVKLVRHMEEEGEGGGGDG